jgi:ribosomal protein S18 acetylase RimI-like enzyme
MIGAGVSETDRFNLIGMWVAPTLRGSGAATRLVDAVKTCALGQGYAQVYLDVAPDNARAASFYLKQGFSFVDEWEPLQSHPHIMVQTMLWAAHR